MFPERVIPDLPLQISQLGTSVPTLCPHLLGPQSPYSKEFTPPPQAASAGAPSLLSQYWLLLDAFLLLPRERTMSRSKSCDSQFQISLNAEDSRYQLHSRSWRQRAEGWRTVGVTFPGTTIKKQASFPFLRALGVDSHGVGLEELKETTCK